MTAVDVDLDVESIEHLDFEQQCEVRFMPVLQMFGSLIVLCSMAKRCEEPAVGIIRCNGCGHSGLCCQKHRVSMMGGVHTMCSVCRREGAGVDVYSFEPLRVTS